MTKKYVEIQDLIHQLSDIKHNKSIMKFFLQVVNNGIHYLFFMALVLC